MKNVYWTIKYKNGFLDNRCGYTRKAVIEDYLARYSRGTLAAWSWAKHRRMNGVSAVKVKLVEVSR